MHTKPCEIVVVVVFSHFVIGIGVIFNLNSRQ